MARSRAGRRDLATLIERTTPGVMAHERLIAVEECLTDLLPLGGLRRGSSVAVGGPAAVSLVLALCAAGSRDGAWVGAVGMESLGLAAAVEHGLVPERLFLVSAPPPSRWAEIVTVAAEGAELIVARVPDRLTPGDVRRVQARLGVRGTVLLLVEGRPSGVQSSGSSSIGGLTDLCLATRTMSWEGIGEGHGRLISRRVIVEVSGRRSGRPHSVELLVPGPSGHVERPPDMAIEPAVPDNVTSLHRAG